MRENVLSLCLIAGLLVALLFFAAACTANAPVEPALPDQQPEAPPVVAEGDVLIQWREPALEALVRATLGKPSEEIMQSDLDHIWSIELIGDTHIYFNNNGGPYARQEDIILNPSFEQNT